MIFMKKNLFDIKSWKIIFISMAVYHLVLIPFANRPWYHFFSGAFLIVLGLFCYGFEKPKN